MSQKELIFEKSQPERVAYSLPDCNMPDVDIEKVIPKKLLRSTLADLPEVSEVDLVRHFTQLSIKNYGVDLGFYPLGSCTMKYNPKINENMSRLSGFAKAHPYQPREMVQGCLELLYKLDTMLSEISGMDRVSIQPAAGAQGEMCGLMIIKAYHMNKGEGYRNKIIVPDSAHGTNPASAAIAGFDVIEVKSDARGRVDITALAELMDNKIAGFMLTNPNTLGLFDENIAKISHVVHEAGGLLYYDGANANAIMGISRPGDMGFDVIHLNLHKTFSTPHVGGGPGSGPVGVKKELVPFLPKPTVEKTNDGYILDYDRPLSIGKVKSFYGNFGVAVKAYAYILSMGAEGLKQASQTAVLNANYIAKKLQEYYDVPYKGCMHETVLSASRQKKFGITALDIAKRLLDYGYHPPQCISRL